jgi:hypothetical protein
MPRTPDILCLLSLLLPSCCLLLGFGVDQLLRLAFELGTRQHVLVIVATLIFIWNAEQMGDIRNKS